MLRSTFIHQFVFFKMIIILYCMGVQYCTLCLRVLTAHTLALHVEFVYYTSLEIGTGVLSIHSIKGCGSRLHFL